MPKLPRKLTRRQLKAQKNVHVNKYTGKGKTGSTRSKYAAKQRTPAGERRYETEIKELMKKKGITREKAEELLERTFEANERKTQSLSVDANMVPYPMSFHGRRWFEEDIRNFILIMSKEEALRTLKRNIDSGMYR